MAYSNTQTTRNHKKHTHGKFALLVIAALGVVYGDIGTSPLYAVNEIFFGHAKIETTPANVLGCIGLIIWTLTIIISIKYIIFVLRADHDGEGGVFALLSLLNKKRTAATGVAIGLLILAAGFLLGDGIITPAISVLSAVEGLNVATVAFQPYIISITLIILGALFTIQQKGTARVGIIFGPIIMIWFAVISVLGLRQIIAHSAILAAFNPIHTFLFVVHQHPLSLFVVLGSVMLTITGGEALYADMGHFGKKPIRVGWFACVYPALFLNYLGQGAYLLSGNAVAHGNIFYSLVPHTLLYPMVILATAATVIASQALISGGFSLASQAVALGLFPRLRIIHTHQEHEGQIYVPVINWMLFIGCSLLVLYFKASTNLAAAYGLAVCGVMFITSISMYVVARNYWKWSNLKAGLLFGTFALIDASFLVANSTKFLEGGFVPLMIGICVFIFITTWQWGRSSILRAYDMHRSLSVREIIALKRKTENQVLKTVIMMTYHPIISLDEKVPALLQTIWDRFETLPRHIIFLHVMIEKIPYLHEDRYEIKHLENECPDGSMTSVIVKFGFMENPQIEDLLESLVAHRKIPGDVDPKNWIFYIIQERITADDSMNFLQKMRFKLFQILLRNSTSADEYFCLGRNVALSTEIFPIKLS